MWFLWIVKVHGQVWEVDQRILDYLVNHIVINIVTSLDFSKWDLHFCFPPSEGGISDNGRFWMKKWIYLQKSKIKHIFAKRRRNKQAKTSSFPKLLVSSSQLALNSKALFLKYFSATHTVLAKTVGLWPCTSVSCLSCRDTQNIKKQYSNG